MKASYLKFVGLCVLAAVVGTGCRAKDTPNFMSIQEAMNSPEAQGFLDPGVRVYFGQGNGHGKKIRTGLISNRKTNGSNKSDDASCQRAFLSAVKSFQDTARKNGATKVINVVSYYNRVPYSSATHYECHTGNLITGVVLKGDIAR